MCGTDDLLEADFVKHVLAEHADHGDMPMVCPVCSTAQVSHPHFYVPNIVTHCRSAHAHPAVHVHARDHCLLRVPMAVPYRPDMWSFLPLSDLRAGDVLGPHTGIECAVCHASDFVGTRYHCLDCQQELCESCLNSKVRSRARARGTVRVRCGAVLS